MGLHRDHSMGSLDIVLSPSTLFDINELKVLCVLLS